MKTAALVLTLLAMAVAASAEVVPRGSLAHASKAAGRLEAPERVHAYAVRCQAPSSQVPFQAAVRVQLREAAKGALATFVRAGTAPASPAAFEWQGDASAPLLVEGAETAEFSVSVAGAPGVDYELSTECVFTKAPRAAPRRVRAAAAEADPVKLENDQVTHGSVATGQDVYYYFDVPAGHCNVSINLAGIQGDPDLYVSNVEEHPNADNANWTSRFYGDDSVTLSGLTGRLYVAVESYTDDSIYTLVAAADCDGLQAAVQLSNGEPVSMSGGAQLFEFKVPASSSDAVAFEVTPLRGDPDLYARVGSAPTEDEYDWSSRAWGADSLVIQPSDPKRCRQHTGTCSYFVLVVGFGLDAGNTEYSITASTSGHLVELQAGVPYELEAAANATAYFTLPSSASALEDLTVTVTARQGDPDLYVSSTETHPTEDSTWVSRLIGSDALTVLAKDPNACKDCTYHLAVQCYGDEECAFTITAAWEQPTVLEDGTEVTGLVGAGATRTFVATVDPEGAGPVTLSLTPVSGLCDMFASLGHLVSPDNASYATHWFDEDQSLQVPVPSGDICRDGSVPGFNLCQLYVAVAGVTNCSFSLVMTTGSERSAVELEDGVPVEADLLEGESNYYRFENYDADTVRFRVTKMSGNANLFGDPDLYVTVPPNANPRPGASNYTYASQGLGDDMVEVEQAPNGVYYAAVYGYTNTSYSIVAESATASDPSVVVLEDGVAQDVQVPRREYRYFLFSLEDGHGDFEFNTECMLGSLQIYMSSTDRLPTFADFDFSGIDHISLRASELEAGQYYIGVYGWSTQSECSVTAVSVTGKEIVSIEDGLPVRGRHAGIGESSYYRFTMSESTPVGLSIILSSLTGDSDLFVSTRSHYPNEHDNEWSSAALGNDVLTIDPSDPKYCVGCDYFINVYSFDYNSTYTLTATGVEIVYLLGGVPERGQVEAGHYRHYNFFVPPSEGTVTVRVDQRTGSPHAGNANLYVSLGSDTFPTRGHAHWHAEWSHGHAVLTIDQDAHEAGCDQFLCAYKISVLGNQNTDYAVTAQIA